MVDVGIRVEDLTHTTHERDKDENSEYGSIQSPLHSSEGSKEDDSDDIPQKLVYRIITGITFGITFLVSTSVSLALAPVFLALPWARCNNVRSEPEIRGIYEKVFFFETLEKKIQRLGLINIARMGCLGLLWLVINLSIPSLKRETLLGSPLWKWSLFVTSMFYLYPCAIHAFIGAYTVMTQFSDPKCKSDKAYFWVGLGTNVSWLLYFASILIIWLAYFHTGHGLKQMNTQSLDMYVTWTLVSFLVGAVLCVVKTSVVLHWKVDAIYRRFKPRILMAGFQLYFLCIIVNRFARLGLMPWRYEQKPMGFSFKRSYNIIEDGRLELNETTNDKKRRSILEHFISTRVSLMRLSGVADLVASLAEVLREDDGVYEVEKICQENISTDENELHITNEHIVDLFKRIFLSPGSPALGDCLSGKNMKDSARLLLMEVRAQQQTSDEPITYEMLRKWLVDAHKDCLALGYTLVDAFAVVNVLERLLTWSIVAIVILFWLIVTGLATTKVLVAIVSPFLALTFMFGDTFKSFFQGVIFSFATHPFDVGDECLIDNDELVVKNINILTTSFYGNNKMDVVLLPNSDLITKRITVHKVVKGRRDARGGAN